MRSLFVLTVVSVSLVLSLGCASPTPAPLPTYTPEPTYTPFPTYTSFPTPTPTPTATSTTEPTSLPMPTVTPDPTPTPEPTSTAVPTLEPTHTPLPTPTPTPIPTSTPVPTPSHTPTPTIEPTVTPVPSAWFTTGVEKDRLTDERKVFFFSYALTDESENSDSSPALAIVCSSAIDAPLFSVHWPDKKIQGTGVAFRFDDHEALLDKSWRRFSENQTVSPLLNSLAYLNRALRASTFFVQLTSTSGQKLTAEFRLEGLAEMMARYQDLCQTPSQTIGEENTLIYGEVVRLTSISTNYEPLYVVGAPKLYFECLKSGGKKLILWIGATGLFLSGDEDDFYSFRLTDSTVQYDDRDPIPVTFEHVGYVVHSLESGLPEFLDMARKSQWLVIRGNLQIGYEFQATFEVSELDGFLNSQLECKG